MEEEEEQTGRGFRIFLVVVCFIVAFILLAMIWGDGAFLLLRLVFQLLKIFG